MRRFASGALVVFTVFAVACSDDDDEPISAATINAIASSICTKTSQCLSDVAVRVLYGSPQTCTTRQAAQLELDKKGSGFSVSEPAAKRCLEKLNTISCDALLTNDLPAECEFKGTLGDGAACSSNPQCASGSCFVADGGTCGKCGTRAPDGGDCSQSRCEKGLVCNTDKRCVRPAGAGVACNERTQCAFGLTCSKGTCVATLAAGAPCTVSGGDAVDLCDRSKGLYCQGEGGGGASGTCASFDLAVAGGACGVVGSPPRPTICEGGDCSGGSLQNRTCVARLADGSPCTEESSCQAPAECRGGRCALLDPTTCR